MVRAEAIDFKAKPTRGIQAIDATAPDMAKKAGGFSTTDINRACIDERSQKNKYSDSISQSEGKVYTTQHICHGCRLGEQELLQLQRIQLFGKELQEQRNRKQNWEKQKNGIQTETED